MQSAESPFFSLIVPCCNVGKYVDELVDSVVGQSFSDWECILFVETSQDDTLDRCQCAERRDARFKVLTGPRSGSASIPRNKGLAAARGRYVVWIDGDDKLVEGALDRIAKDVHRADEPDIIHYAANQREEDADGRVVRMSRIFSFPDAENGRMLTGEEAMCAIVSPNPHFYPVPWLMAIRVDFLRENGLEFLPRIRYEDLEWMPRVLYAARRVFVDNTVCYLYRHRYGSVTRRDFTSRELACLVVVFRSLFNFFVTHAFTRRLATAWARGILSPFFSYFFAPKRFACINLLAWSVCIRCLLRNRGWVNFVKLARFAGLPKKVAVPLVLMCGLHPALGWPARAYFRYFYYPLVMRQVKRRGS